MDSARAKDILAELKLIPPLQFKKPGLPPKHPTGISHLLRPHKVRTAAFGSIEETKTDLSHRETPKSSTAGKSSGRPDLLRHDSSKQASIEDYSVGKAIGQGAYATVYFATHNSTNKRVAVKTFDKARLQEASRKKGVLREIRLLNKLKHPHIVKLIDSFETPQQMHLILEYLSGGSLQYYMKRCPRGHFTEGEAKRLFLQITSAVDYCHSVNVTHRDLKLDNILLDEKRNAKLIDFGFATCFPNDRKIKLFCGTPSYMAPEIVTRKEYAGPPADVWALGVLLYVMLCGFYPFKGKDDKDLFQRIIIGQFEIPHVIPAAPRGLIYRMLNLDPDRRPSVKEIKHDPWLSDMNSSRAVQLTRSSSSFLAKKAMEAEIDSSNEVNLDDQRANYGLPSVKSRVVKVYRHLKE
eukprot:CAMPEP_0204915052 /NCGR_PEP_ID=MMETSP1397-20131031/13043_1 /ASSEMBLY_ACC=CAM_ASM_000891 /TAXON_ID=49980 /ORGANISM="Climacostomum Climacostomum virens, Strain Stock W-24" /LENGTH=407 /DNA_ID=CAMNT_0052086909 /DNA_START=202 /DNA_END=1422 /DNA_ORIENTATION=-